MKSTTRLLAAALLGLSAWQAQAQIRITEVAPWSSGNSAVAADWFEVTNFGTAPITLTGWKVDDSSNSLASSVALQGITTIAAGESVIFIEGASANANFLSNWFGANAPAGLQIGRYSGSGIGLSTGSDAVNLFDAAGVLVTRVDFGASPSAAPFASFDNALGLDNVRLAGLSVLGVNGAFLASSGVEIGSPGAVSAVPEPASLALLLGGLAVVAGAARRRT